MDNIEINAEQISGITFAKNVINNVVKQITTVPYIDVKTGEITNQKLTYGIKFNVAGSTLKHALNMATLNSKTDIGNNFRSRCKKDVDNLNNDTFEFFQSMLDDGVLVVSGFPTGLPDVPETPEQRKRTVVATYSQMDKNERAELIKFLMDSK